jgi:hypothetical protein
MIEKTSTRVQRNSVLVGKQMVTPTSKVGNPYQ